MSMDNYVKDENASPKGLKKWLVLAAIVVIGLIVFMSASFIVRPNQYAVVRQFGRVVSVIDSPGLKFKVPLVQSVSYMPQQNLFYDVRAAEINTLDKKRIVVDYYGVWKITDPLKMIENLRIIEAAEMRMGDNIYSTIRTELGKLFYDQIINYKKLTEGDWEESEYEEENEVIIDTDHLSEDVMELMENIETEDENGETVEEGITIETDTETDEDINEDIPESIDEELLEAILVRESIDSIVQDKVNQILADNNYGIELVDVKMRRTELPAANEQSVYERMITERKGTAQEYLSQGQAEAIRIRREADRTVSDMTAKAKAESEAIVAEGEREAARIYNESYGRDPEFFNMYRTLQSYETTLMNEPVIIIPSNSPYLNYLLQ